VQQQQQQQQQQQRPSTTKVTQPRNPSAANRPNPDYINFEGLSQNEATMYKAIQEEHNRRAGWVRIFPTADTWEFFSAFLETRSTSYNLVLHQKLFPKRWLYGTAKKNGMSRAK